MSLQLSGTLHRPSVGDPLKNTRVLFRARVTSTDTVMGATAEITTDADGAYAVSLYPGRYDIGVYLNGHLHFLARDVLIDAESTAATLNDLVLQAEHDGDITPAALIEFRALKTQAETARDETTQARDTAGGYRDQAQTYRDEAAAVVTGGTATLDAEPGKIPLAGDDGTIDDDWTAGPVRLAIVGAIAYATDLAGQAARAIPSAYLRALAGVLYVDDQGRVGVGTDTPGAALDIAGGRERLRESSPPVSSSSPGLPGEQAWDSNYEYRCVAANSWRRIPLQAF